MPYDNLIHVYVICNILVITHDNVVVLSIDDKVYVHAMWLCMLNKAWRSNLVNKGRYIAGENICTH